MIAPNGRGLQSEGNNADGIMRCVAVTMKWTLVTVMADQLRDVEQKLLM